MHKVDFSFIIPVFNSVNTLGPLFLGIKETMEELGHSYEVIFIEDNGSDESWKTLLELKKEQGPNISLIKLTKNFGQNSATLCGIDHAKGHMIATLDDDLQIHPSEIKKLISHQKIHGTDVIYGTHRERSNSWLRNLGSRLIKKVFTKSEGGSNLGSSMRLITSDIAAHLRNHSQDHLFINQVISWYTFNSAFVEVECNPRAEGKSGYSTVQLLLIAFRLIFLYTSIPLKLMIGICVISSLVTISLAGYYIYEHFVFGRGLGFLVVIVVSISLILASISVMGIFLNRLYTSRVRKPHYAIKVKL